MKKSKFSDAQETFILKQGMDGVPAAIANCPARQRVSPAQLVAES